MSNAWQVRGGVGGMVGQEIVEFQMTDHKPDTTNIKTYFYYNCYWSRYLSGQNLLWTHSAALRESTTF